LQVTTFRIALEAVDAVVKSAEERPPEGERIQDCLQKIKGLHIQAGIAIRKVDLTLKTVFKEPEEPEKPNVHGPAQPRISRRAWLRKKNRFQKLRKTLKHITDMTFGTLTAINVLRGFASTWYAELNRNLPW
jgi:hypothetical protein